GWSELRSPALQVEPGGTMARWPVKQAPSSGLRLPLPGADGEILLEGLLPATHRLVVLRRGSEEAGAGEVEVLAGRTVPLVIEVEPGEDPLVEITGTLTVPKSWGRFARAIHLQRKVKDHIFKQGDYLVVKPPPEGETVTFRTKALAPGTYFVEVQPFQWRTQVEVPAAGVHLKLVLPEPAELLVEVVDDATSDHVPSAEVTWHLVLPGLTSYSLDHVPWSVELSRFRAMIPQGEIRLNISADGYLERQVELRVARSGRIEETVRLTTAGTIRVRFTLGGKPFPADDLWVTVAGRIAKRCRDVGVDFPSLPPGKYRLSVKDVAGMKPVPVREVEVRRGETTEVTIELERKE
ncbi:MAG: carboxypeptidase-like regulatory domain-containing protein, partial [Planctomycetota bacterium]